MTFNNRRIVHARKSFELNGGVRHLKVYIRLNHPVQFYDFTFFFQDLSGH